MSDTTAMPATDPGAPVTPPTPVAAYPELTHRQILGLLSGLLTAMFVSNVAGTIVGNALPTITGKLHSSEQEYMWIVTSTLLASTASTPIWGKLADLFDKKRLILVGLGVFTLGSILSGSATSTGMLIATRAVQGVGLGAIQSLVQAIMGTAIPPRARGRYMAYTGATMAVATVIAPLIGGFIVGASWLGWRWCFWSAVPFALLSMVVLQKQLHVTHIRVPGATVDWLGSTIITAATSALLIWISFVDKQFAWLDWETFALLGCVVVGVIAFVYVENHVANPIIPMPIVKMRVTALAIIASIAVGVGMFGGTVFLGQYFQLARGESPTMSGLLMFPMMIGVLLSSMVIGRLVSRLGIWKPFTVVGAVCLTIGFLLLGTIDDSTSFVVMSVYMVIAGLGVGMTMQNLVLAVQNSISVRDVGAATGAVTFFRSLGGAIGIQALGFVFEDRLSRLIQEGLPGLLASAVQQDSWARPASADFCQTVPGLLSQASGSGALDPALLGSLAEQCPTTAGLLESMATLEASGGSTMDVKGLAPQVAHLVQHSIGQSVGLLFTIGGIISAVSLIVILFMRSTRLRTHFNLDE
ncbi:MAG: MFS transporter [Propionibacteriaceae bacterium]|jgi:EmrB/QacA subfamily drug resistance transporter|nr:MFS transporter [Propionibacteriaceae bacterium]